MRPSPCLSLDTRIPAPGFSSRSTTTPRPYQPCTGLRPVLVKVGAPGPSLSRWSSCSPRAPAAAAVTAGPQGRGGPGEGWAPRRVAIGCSPWARGGVTPRLLCHWPRCRWGPLPAPWAAQRRTAGARRAKPAWGRLARSQLRRRPADPDRCARRLRQRQELARGSVASAALGKTGTAQGFGEGGWAGASGNRSNRDWSPNSGPRPGGSGAAAASPASNSPGSARGEQVALPGSVSERIRIAFHPYPELPLTLPLNTQTRQF